MEIRVSGHQVDTGEALQAHVAERMQAIADKYFSRTISSSVTFSNAPHGAFRCDIVCHVMAGLILKGAGEAHDAHVCFDQAAERIEKQLRRYMRRLKDRHSQALAAEAQRDAPGIDDANYVVFQSSEAEEEVDVDAPVVIAEMRVDIPRASVSDAVMMLDLRNTNALMFLNSSTATFNMVYRRTDGTIGWVEPPRA
ncbi:ribosomal subunit interface protein [Sphingobium sp. B2D3A]|uniref:ribosome hibernation-promoting factor, HPF/YfiA family n=1 Tax=Sphingobium TaxID=165695 RepID=UPI0015EC48EF|nr:MULTISPECIES: ribosome-associated translation inhibitor RaiA [Sphingobium]MCW2336365.1 ribosomal subunit interface protein [Sphingobium sp. B2D3A]MCW2348802.1 ribosomal subunit interface protein [Sphingobium sp. B12D2B]MCW2363488.1 ribosomal subunit interface protein [Sphingobium sp. B10D3B]MCW2364736.1 ribosomal subunit interface protein [Sphingobium sp. B7D2B]MCW2367929.1 ribosomal subunit interface protein [Sphingobium sp. B11D3D]